MPCFGLQNALMHLADLEGENFSLREFGILQSSHAAAESRWDSSSEGKSLGLMFKRRRGFWVPVQIMRSNIKSHGKCLLNLNLLFRLHFTSCVLVLQKSYMLQSLSAGFKNGTAGSSWPLHAHDVKSNNHTSAKLLPRIWQMTISKHDICAQTRLLALGIDAHCSEQGFSSGSQNWFWPFEICSCPRDLGTADGKLLSCLEL